MDALGRLPLWLCWDLVRPPRLQVTIDWVPPRPGADQRDGGVESRSGPLWLCQLVELPARRRPELVDLDASQRALALSR
jgi:hypothetical protein